MKMCCFSSQNSNRDKSLKTLVGRKRYLRTIPLETIMLSSKNVDECHKTPRASLKATEKYGH